MNTPISHADAPPRSERRHGPDAGVRERARSSGGGADGGDQARGRPGPAGRARGVGAESVCGVSCAARSGGGRGRGTAERERGREGEEGGEGRGVGCAQGTDVCVRVPASRQDITTGYGGKRSALHWASAKGLAGTVAKLLALGADATLTDKVRTSAVYRYPHVLICTRISTNTLVCNTAWKPERSSLVSFLIVRDNTGQARNKLRSRLWTLEGLVHFRRCIHAVWLSVCVCVCAHVRVCCI